MTPKSKHIAVKYHWFRQQFGKEFVIRKIESENLKADMFTKGLQGRFINQDKEVSMRLEILNLRGVVGRNDICSLNGVLMIQERYFGLLGSTHIPFIFLIYPIKRYSFLKSKIDICRISMTHQCHWNMQMQPTY